MDTTCERTPISSKHSRKEPFKCLKQCGILQKNSWWSLSLISENVAHKMLKDLKKSNCGIRFVANMLARHGHCYIRISWTCGHNQYRCLTFEKILIILKHLSAYDTTVRITSNSHSSCVRICARLPVQNVHSTIFYCKKLVEK